MFSSALRKQPVTPESLRLSQIVLVRGQDTQGQNTWFYLMVDSGKLKAFKANHGKAMVTLTDYGRILYCGYGENPSDIIQWKMKKEYGFTNETDSLK